MSAERKEWDGIMNMALVLAWSLSGGLRMREGYDALQIVGG